MIVYRCDMCQTVHESIGEMFNVKVCYAGSSRVSLPRDGEYQVCGKCENKLLRSLGAFGKEGKKLEPIYEPSVGDIVYKRVSDDKFEKVKILDGEFYDSKYGRLSNFWKWENLETGEIEEDYGCFYREVYASV